MANSFYKKTAAVDRSTAAAVLINKPDEAHCESTSRPLRVIMCNQTSGETLSFTEVE
jgi:hypothetical protein